MTLQLGEVAPNFKADSTDGLLDFYEYLGSSWGVLFSHPADFTPVCTTELGRVAALKPEFERRNTKVIGLSVDGLADHNSWSRDIAETQGTALNFPLIADQNRRIAGTYGMIHPMHPQHSPCAQFLLSHPTKQLNSHSPILRAQGETSMKFFG